MSLRKLGDFMVLETEDAYKLIFFWFVFYRLKATNLSLHVDKAKQPNHWILTPKK